MDDWATAKAAEMEYLLHASSNSRADLKRVAKALATIAAALRDAASRQDAPGGPRKATAPRSTQGAPGSSEAIRRPPGAAAGAF